LLHSILFSTLGQLATGILLFIAFVPPSKIGKGFARFHVALALILWIVALRGKLPLEFLITGGLLLGAFLSASSDRSYYPFLAAGFLASLYLLIQYDGIPAGYIQSLAIHIPPALVLGASSVAMLLGHWYLVSPKLSIGYLKAGTIGLIVSLLIRSVLLLVVILSARLQLESIRFFDVYGIFFWQRVALGLLLTLVLSVLTYFCVKIRSTQSATGILYVVLVFCLIGEVIASYLFTKTGIWF
jgi:hypothetical protein